MSKHRDTNWADAKQRCRLSVEDMAMAKELGLNPRSLIKNIPNRSEPWKLPVKDWVRNMYFKRFGNRTPHSSRHEEAHPLTHAENQSIPTPPAATSGADPQPAAPPPHLLREAENELFRKADREEIDPERFSDEMGRIATETPVSDGEIEEENQFMLKRQQGFRRAAELIAACLSQLSFVQKVVLFGSVAAPLTKEVPRFRRLRRARAAIWHECKDVDLAVWVSDLSQLRQMKKAIGSALNVHQAEAFQNNWPGVPHHQVDVFLFEPGTHRYRGNLCHYGACPKGKLECEVAGCGAQPFLQLYEDFKFDRFAPFGEHSVVLFERAASVPAESSPNADEVPF